MKNWVKSFIGAVILSIGLVLMLSQTGKECIGTDWNAIFISVPVFTIIFTVLIKILVVDKGIW